MWPKNSQVGNLGLHSLPEHCHISVSIRTEGRVTWVHQGSVLAAIHSSIYSMIQRVHIKFTDGKNLEGNETIAKEKIVWTKKENNVWEKENRMHPNRDKLKILQEQMNHTNTEEEMAN